MSGQDCILEGCSSDWVPSPCIWHKEISVRWGEPSEEEHKKGSKHSYGMEPSPHHCCQIV